MEGLLHRKARERLAEERHREFETRLRRGAECAYLVGQHIDSTIPVVKAPSDILSAWTQGSSADMDGPSYLSPHDPIFAIFVE